MYLHDLIQITGMATNRYVATMLLVSHFSVIFGFVVIVISSFHRMADCTISVPKSPFLPSSCNSKIQLPPLTTAKQNTTMTPSGFYIHPFLPNIVENPRLVKLPPLPNPPPTTWHFCPAVPPICHPESTDNDGDLGKLVEEDFEQKLAYLRKTNGHLSLPRLRRIIMRQQKRTKVEQIRVVSFKVFITYCT